MPLARYGSIAAIVPSGLEDGRASIRVAGVSSAAFVDIAAPFATGLHQVDNPVFDADGNLAAIKRRVKPDEHTAWALAEVEKLKAGATS